MENRTDINPRCHFVVAFANCIDVDVDVVQRALFIVLYAIMTF